MDNVDGKRAKARETQAQWLKASRVATELDVSTRTVKRWIADGKVEAIRLTPDGEWRVSRASLDAWLETLRSRCSPRPDDAAAAGS